MGLSIAFDFRVRVAEHACEPGLMPTSTVDVKTPGGVADAYLSRPDGDGPHPAVLLMMDAFGLRPRIAEMAERIAEQGYVVLAPNLFHRAGRTPVVALPDMSDPDQRARFMAAVRPLMGALDPERAASDGGAYLDHLATVAPGPVAITGYCMGGRFGWRVAAAHPDRVAALGAFHAGGLVTDAPDSPHLSAGEIAAELYLGFADQDRSMTAEQIAVLERALDDAGVRYRSETYEGASHGYTMSDTAAYDEAAAERHFAELFALLERTVSDEFRPTPSSEET
jgi:carboxymethylenebutenolidase